MYGLYILITNLSVVSNLLSAVNSDMNKHLSSRKSNAVVGAAIGRKSRYNQNTRVLRKPFQGGAVKNDLVMMKQRGPLWMKVSLR